MQPMINENNKDYNEINSITCVFNRFTDINTVVKA